MGFFSGKTGAAPDNEVLIAVLEPIASGIFQDILRDNHIPFVCRNHGAGGYMKILFGAGAAADYIYVNPADEAPARELFDAYLCTEVEAENEEN